MRNHRTRVPVCMTLMSFGLAAALIQPTAALASNAKASQQQVPNGQGCTPKKTFIIAHTSFPDLGDRNTTAWTWQHNRNSRDAHLMLSFAAQSSVGESIAATAGVDAGVIFAKVSTSVTVGIEHSHSDTETKSASVGIPAHKFGVLGADVFYARVTGTYKKLEDGPGGSCRTVRVKNVIAEFPTRDPMGFEDQIVKKAPALRPPWPLAPR